ncbi:FxsA family protein [Paenibacillus tarimensis]|uniref:FxsA family protein n=1 Tax=Paenibacillus tarimensis TaxID=416012 RepID=UPI001F2AA88E|nr:FxsA family protein [Paenibacillus tarimensis]MCF2943897.1 membrane protein FxsA [Paenibacillus tarimensis]
MGKWILLAIVIIPAIEIWGILRMGSWIGGTATFLLILLTGVIGAYLARKEGRKALLEAQRQMQSGQIPGRTLLDGICIVIGGVLLLTPGFITDAVGFSLLIPPTRMMYRGILLKWLEKRLRSGQFVVRRW